MRKYVAFGLLVALALVAAPALAATAPEAAAPVATTELTVDDLLLVGAVTTELLTARKCPIEVLGCNHVDDDCGVLPGYCHCKATPTPGQYVCVGNPTPPGPIE